MNGPGLSCVTGTQGPVGRIRLAGVLAPGDVPLIRATLDRMLADQPDTIVVDLTGLHAVDDRALGVFPATAGRARLWPATMLVLVTAPAVAAALDRTGAARSVITVPSVAQAMACASRPGRRDRVHQWFDPVASAPVHARAMVQRVCVSWGLADRADAAQLVVTELVSNAVRYARTELRVSLVVQGGRLLIAVRDRCATPPRLVSPDDGLATGGRGLTVVAALATCWGCMVDAYGKDVWAGLPVAGDP